MTDSRQPWMKWFPTDWHGDESLQMCSLAARGFWVECIGLMHKAQPYGYLLLHGKPPNDKDLAKFVRATVKEVRRCLTELHEHRVYDTDDKGVVFSRRMVRKARRSAIAAANGSHGGNPRLVNQNHSRLVNQNLSDEDKQRSRAFQKPEARSQKEDLSRAEGTPRYEPPPNAIVSPEIADRAGRFLERYEALYEQHMHGAFYRVKPARDYPYACELVAGWSDDRLDRMAALFLQVDLQELRGKSRTVGEFLYRAPWCDAELRKSGL